MSWSRTPALMGAMTIALSGTFVGTAVSAPGAVDRAAAGAIAAIAERKCPPTWGWPPLSGNWPTEADDNIAVLIGGDFLVGDRSAEVEGRVWVDGDTVIDRDPVGIFNLGRIGFGSQVAPSSGSDMLMTGGSLTVTPGNLLDVAHGLQGGGNVLVGGAVDHLSRIETNGGLVSYELGAEATSDYVEFGNDLAAFSRQLADETANGAVRANGRSIHFTGTGPDDVGTLQVFEIRASQLGLPAVDLYFRDIPAETPVVINVIDDQGGSASFNPTWIQDEDERSDLFESESFARVAVRTLWNFPDSTELGLLGSNQILGSILAMSAENTLVTASTNGRVYVGGNLTMKGFGNELHNYHWPWELTECEDTTDPDPEPGPDPQPIMGRIAVAKWLYGEPMPMGANPVLNTDARFAGVAQCEGLPDQHVAAKGFRWRTAIGEVAERDNLAVGQDCVLEEMAPEEPLDEGFIWAEPLMDPEDGRVTVTEERQQVDVFVNNAVIGAFEVAKEVSGPAGGFVNPNRQFEVDYSCSLDGALRDGFDAEGVLQVGSATGTILVQAGLTTRSWFYPLGTVCSLSENLTSEDTDFDGSYEWSQVSWEPSNQIAIEASGGEARRVTVTNHFEERPTQRASFTVTKEIRGSGEDEPASPGREFIITYACTIGDDTSMGFDPIDGSVAAPEGKGSFRIEDGETQSSPLFQPGTECTLSEAQDGDPDDGYLWTEVEFSPANQIVLDSDHTAVAVLALNTLTRVEPDSLSSFQVAKAIESTDDTDGFVNWNRTFSVDYSCVLDGAPSFGYDDERVQVSDGSGTLYLGATGIAASTPLFRDGTECTLTERWEPRDGDFADNSYEWTGSDFSPSASVVLGGDSETQLVTLTNRFTRTGEAPGVFAPISLKKQVEGPGEAVVNPERVFEFTYTCSLDGNLSPGFDRQTFAQISTGTGTIDLKVGEVWEGPLFAVGTECDFTENLELREGDFPGSDGNYWWSDFSFNRPMPVTITQTESPYAVEVYATNHFAKVEEFGSFSAAKAIAGPTLDALAADLEFTVDFECTRGGYPATGYDQDGNSVTTDGTGFLDLPADGTVVSAPLFRSGAVCALSEDLDSRADDFTSSGYYWQNATFTPAGPITVGGGQSVVEVSLLNTFAGRGSFLIDKLVQGPDGSDSQFLGGDRGFEIEYSCTYQGHPVDGWNTAGELQSDSSSGTLNITTESGATSLDFPLGTECELTENLISEEDEFDEGYRWKKIEILPSATVTIATAGASHEVSVVNHFAEVPAEVGTFAVTKTATVPTGSALDPERIFTVDYVCTIDGEPAMGFKPGTNEVKAPYGKASLSVRAGETAESLEFEAGTSCTLSEAAEDAEPTDGLLWTGGTFSPSDTVTVADGRQAVTITATNRFETVEQTELAAFSLTKQISGPAGAFIATNRTFTVDYQCLRDGEPSLGYDADNSVIAPTGTGRLLLPADGTAVTSPYFAVGTTCTLSERSAPYPDDFVSDAYRWGDAVFTPSNTVALETEASVTLTNYIALTEVDPEKLEPETDTGTPELSNTGPSLIALSAGLLLLLVGGALLLYWRSRRIVQ